MVLARLRHSVDYPGQLASLPVVPVVVEEFSDGDQYKECQDTTERLEDSLSLLGLL